MFITSQLSLNHYFYYGKKISGEGNLIILGNKFSLRGQFIYYEHLRLDDALKREMVIDDWRGVLTELRKRKALRHLFLLGYDLSTDVFSILIELGEIDFLIKKAGNFYFNGREQECADMLFQKANEEQKKKMLGYMPWCSLLEDKRKKEPGTDNAEKKVSIKEVNPTQKAKTLIDSGKIEDVFALGRKNKLGKEVLEYVMESDSREILYKRSVEAAELFSFAKKEDILKILFEEGSIEEKKTFFMSNKGDEISELQYLDISEELFIDLVKAEIPALQLISKLREITPKIVEFSSYEDFDNGRNAYELLKYVNKMVGVDGDLFSTIHYSSKKLTINSIKDIKKIRNYLKGLVRILNLEMDFLNKYELSSIFKSSHWTEKLFRHIEDDFSKNEIQLLKNLIRGKNEAANRDCKGHWDKLNESYKVKLVLEDFINS